MAALGVHSIILLNRGVNLYTIHDLMSLVAVLAAFSAVCITSAMPLRDPVLPSADISSVGDAPTIHQRSPEDRLRLYQFLSITWIEPLLSIGKKRQLDEEDVWSLGYTFQHKRLHEAFRQLRGSVIRRVFRANGIDVFVISITALINTLCGEFNPSLSCV